jgi:hypothetical protein
LAFDKVVSLDWYDGITSGLAMCSQFSLAFKFDLLAWDESQERRVFAFAPLTVKIFEHIVRRLGRKETAPEWPIWYPKWPSGLPEKKLLKTEIDKQLTSAKPPDYIIASDSMFTLLLAARRLDGSSRELLPPNFDGVPFRDNFDYWQEYLGVHR